MTNETKQKYQNAKSSGDKLKTKGSSSLFYFFYVICKIPNFDMWTAEHLVQASCTELSLLISRMWQIKAT